MPSFIIITACHRTHQSHSSAFCCRLFSCSFLIRIILSGAAFGYTTNHAHKQRLAVHRARHVWGSQLVSQSTTRLAVIVPAHLYADPEKDAPHTTLGVSLSQPYHDSCSVGKLVSLGRNSRYTAGWRYCALADRSVPGQLFAAG